jgi:hypothetical protein
MHADTFTSWAPKQGSGLLKPLAAALAALDLAVSWILCVAMAVT